MQACLTPSRRKMQVHPLQFFAGSPHLPMDHMALRITQVFQRHNIDKYHLLGSPGSSSIEARDIECTVDGQWLNDNVMNAAFAAFAKHCGAASLLGSRFPSRPGSRYPFVYAGTAFVSQLCGTAHNQYDSVGVTRSCARTIKKLFDNDTWILPVNFTKSHFCVEVVFLKTRIGWTFDSGRGGNGSEAVRTSLFK